MNLYLLRHGIATVRGTGGLRDEERPLTREGIEKMTAAARSFPALIGTIDRILTSPLVRAKETAMIAAKEFRAAKKVHIVNELAPGTSIERIYTLLNEHRTEGNVMLVGHEPDLSMLASALIGAGSSVIELKKGSLCAISIDGAVANGSGTLVFLFQPKHLRGLRLT
jgi:phosphohistidine phosphatase